MTVTDVFSTSHKQKASSENTFKVWAVYGNNLYLYPKVLSPVHKKELFSFRNKLLLNHKRRKGRDEQVGASFSASTSIRKPS